MLKSGQLPIEEREAFHWQRISWISYQPISLLLLPSLSSSFPQPNVPSFFRLFFVSTAEGCLPLMDDIVNFFSSLFFPSHPTFSKLENYRGVFQISDLFFVDISQQLGDVLVFPSVSSYHLFLNQMCLLLSPLCGPTAEGCLSVPSWISYRTIPLLLPSLRSSKIWRRL